MPSDSREWTCWSCISNLCLQSWLRVSQRLHTISQIGVGAAVGSLFSILWYLFWKAIVSEAFASYLWVQIVVIFGAAAFCLGFVIYVICYWFRDERL